MKRNHDAFTDPVEVLRNAPDDRREDIWERMTGEQKSRVWQLAPKDRRPLLPKSLRKYMSRCCCDTTITQAIMEARRPHSTNMRQVGRVAICSNCWTPQKPPEFQNTPDKWGMAIWNLMCSSQSLYGKFTFSYDEAGNITNYDGVVPL